MTTHQVEPEARTRARFLEVPGGRLYVVDEGSGPPIVLLHAAIVDHRAWDAVAPALLSAGYRAVRYDARGFGRSTTTDVEYAPHEDAIAVMDALDLDRALLVGNSLGGSAAMDVALAHPDRVAGVVMVASDPNGFRGELTDAEQRLDEEGQRLEQAEPRDVDALVDFDMRIWADGPGQPRGRGGATANALVAEIDREQYAPGHVSGRRIGLAPRAMERLGELQCPVLAVTGEYDFSVFRQAAELMASRCRNARWVEMPGVAHLLGIERPVELADLIVDFAGRLPGI